MHNLHDYMQEPSELRQEESNNQRRSAVLVNPWVNPVVQVSGNPSVHTTLDCRDPIVSKRILSTKLFMKGFESQDKPRLNNINKEKC